LRREDDYDDGQMPATREDAWEIKAELANLAAKIEDIPTDLLDADGTGGELVEYLRGCVPLLVEFGVVPEPTG